MLRSLGRPVATSCDMLGVENQTSAHALRSIVARNWPNDNNMQHPHMLPEEFDQF